MDARERSRDVYEHIPAYPKPPLIPLPEPGDLESLEKIGLKPGKLSRGIVRSVFALTGFDKFQTRLPEKLEDLLRSHHARGVYLFSPVISATLALQDDPRELDPIARASTLLIAARSLYDDLFAGKFEPDWLRGQPLEMGQYPNLFSTSLAVEGGKPRMYKSTETSCIAIAIHRRLYTQQIGRPGVDTTAEQLEDALARLVERAAHHRLRAAEPSPGLLTAAGHLTQRKIFARLQEDPTNRQSLEALRHTFLTLCLDLDSFPASPAEAAFQAHSGNCANRWYHSSLQIVIFGNSRACVICNFSAYLDGNTMMRGAAEMQKRAAASPSSNPVSRDGSSAPGDPELPPAVELNWRINPRAAQAARREVQQVLDRQQATFEFDRWGAAFLKAHQVSPIPAFILALQMSLKRFTGRAVPITQFLAMSRYRCMDLVTANVTRPEVVRFVEYLESRDFEWKQARALLQEAIQAQELACRHARRNIPLPDIFISYLATLKGFQQGYVALIVMVGFFLLRRLGLLKPRRTEVIVSHPEIYPEIPVVGRPGVRLPYVTVLGLHYQIMENRIVITWMPSLAWTIPNAELFAELSQSLKQIEEILCKGG
jgi:hypothetical protein